jgi:hypothetical protein
MESRSYSAAIAQETPILRRARQVRTPGVLSTRVRNDLQIGTRRRTNLLIVGHAASTRIVLDILRLELAGPVLTWHPGQPLLFPEPGRGATLVVHEPLRLTAADQERMVRWLNEVVSEVRIVSTTPEPLWPHVQSGAFNETLYYRLNPMSLEVGHTR